MEFFIGASEAPGLPYLPTHLYVPCIAGEVTLYMRSSCVIIHNMKSADVIKRLEVEGWKKAGGRGDHVKFKHPDRSGHVVVPHPRKEIPVGTLRNIYRQAGWDWR